MSTTENLEVEAKFTVDPDTAVPALISLAEVATVDPVETINLSAVYYDTEDLRLTRNKLTLRRRTGGADAGWHLKTPAEHGRIEYGAPLGEEGAAAPAEILGPVRALIRDLPLKPIAQVDNRREQQILRDATGAPVAEFCDDHVTAMSLLPGGEVTEWREWELELAQGLPGTPRAAVLMRHAHSMLLAAGADDSDSPSKLRTALSDSVDNVPLPDAPERPAKGTAARTVVDALTANRDRLLQMDPAVRRDEEDSIHQMRVATRELRSHLQTFEGILGGDEYERVEKELKALASILGIARDAEVVAARFLALLDRDETYVLPDATRADLTDTMSIEYKRAHRNVVLALDSERYLALLDSLDNLLLEPPVVSPRVEAGENEEGDVGKRGTSEILSEHLATAYRDLRKKHRKAVKGREGTSLPLVDRENRFHSVRKAAKKLRYSAEAAQSAGLNTKKLIKACKKLQSALGDFQDTVTAREVLQRKAAFAHQKGRDTFGYGVLFQIEYLDGHTALQEYDELFASIESEYATMIRKNDLG